MHAICGVDSDDVRGKQNVDDGMTKRSRDARGEDFAYW